MTVSDLSHLRPPFIEAALLSDPERIHWLRQERWIQYPRAERILERLMDLVDYPPRDRMPCLVIYGSTGMGKTRIIQKFLRDNRTHFDKKLGRTRLPVVSIQMPPLPTNAICMRSFWRPWAGFSPTERASLRYATAFAHLLASSTCGYWSSTRSIRFSPAPSGTANIPEFDSISCERSSVATRLRWNSRSQAGAHD